MDTIKSILWFIISMALISLAFFGLSKFVVWYTTFNSFIFYFLAFWFAWSIRFIPSRLRAIPKSIELFRSTGYSFLKVFKVIIQIIVLTSCLAYLTHTILTNKELYQNWKIIGLISFILFVILSTLTIIGSALLAADD